MATDTDLMRYAMEDAAIAVFLDPSRDLYLASIAISMKRIADAITDQPDIHCNLFDLLAGIEMNGRKN